MAKGSPDMCSRTKAVRAATTLTALLAMSACAGGDNGDDSSGSADSFGSGATFSIESALDQIPEIAADSDDGDYAIEVADILEASELLGVERPTGSVDGVAILNWLRPMSGVGESILYVPIPQEMIGNSDEMGDYRDEIGFAITDVDASVALRAGPGSLVVLAGELNVAASLDELDGVLTLGEGEDFEMDIANRTAVRQLGRPLRLSTRDQLVAMSPSTDIVASWGDPDSERLSADPVLVAVARELDERNVVGARIVHGYFAWSEELAGLGTEPIEQQLPIRTPFDTVALGWGVTDGAAAITVVYVFADEAAAATASTEITAAWSTAESLVGWGPVSDIVVLGEVLTRGSLVVASITPQSGRLPSVVQRMFLGRDAPFVYAL